MIKFREYISLEEALDQSLYDPDGLQELASLNESTIQRVGQLAFEEDWYGDGKLLSASSREIWNAPSPAPFLSHIIWCAHREAQWLLRRWNFEETGLQYHYHQPEHFIRTENKPIIIITPMTLGTYDALNIMLKVIQQFQPHRKVVFYGENMETYLKLYPEHRPLFVEDTLSGVKHILHTLRSGGLFVTYPDFVYQQHASVESEMFGMTRNISRSFLKIALNSEAELLPATVTRIDDELHIQFYSPVPANKSNGFKMLSEIDRLHLQCFLISKILEGLIVKVPNQWRLLPTLTHESVDMA